RSRDLRHQAKTCCTASFARLGRRGSRACAPAKCPGGKRKQGMRPGVLALETRGDVRFCEIYGNSPRSAALAIRTYLGGSCNVRNCRCAQPCWAKRSNNVRDGTVGEQFHLPEGPYRRALDGARVW